MNRSIVGSYVARLLSVIVALGLLVDLKEKTAPEQLDLIFLYLSFIPVYVNLAKFGSNTSIIHRAMKGKDFANYFLDIVFPILAGSILIPIFHLLVVVRNGDPSFGLILELIAITFMLSIISLFTSVYQARGDYIRVYLFQGVNGMAISLPLIVYVELAVEPQLSGYYFVFACICIVIIVYLFTHNNMWSTLNKDVSMRLSVLNVKANGAYLLNDTGWYLVMAICSSLIVSRLQSGELGEFVMIMRFGLVLVLIQQATNMVYGPKIARLFMDRQHRGAVALYIRSAMTASIVAGFAVSFFSVGVGYFSLADMVPVNSANLAYLNIVFALLIFSFLLGPSENVNIFLGRKKPIFWSNIIGAIVLLGFLVAGAELSIFTFIVMAMSFLVAKKIVNTVSVFFMVRDSIT